MMNIDVNSENARTSYKHLTVKRVAQVALPVVAMFAGASSRLSNVSSNRRSSRGGANTFVLNEKPLVFGDAQTISGQETKTVKQNTVFSAFSNKKSLPTKNVKNDTHDAMAFLRSNGLLSSENNVPSNVSGDIYGVTGRKSFAHESQFDHCHASWGETYNTNTTTITETSCTTSWNGTWENASPNPVISTTSVQNKTATSFDVAVTMSKASTVYAVLVESSAGAPSSAQVEAGTNGDDVAAVQTKTGAASNSITLSFTGLDANKNYLVYLIGKDAINNVTSTPGQVNPAYESGLISNVGTWKFPKTRVDSSGNIYLAHASSGQINFLEWNGSGFSAVTTITAADVAGRANMGWGNEHRVDYELDSSGNIHVIFNASTDQWAVNNDPFYGVYNGTAWTITNIGETGYLGGEFDLFLDENDKAHLSFNLTPDADRVKYATNVSGSWVISNVVTSTNSGTDEIHDTYCVVDSSGVAHVFYRREDSQNNSQDNYYYASSSDSFSAQTKILDGKTDAKVYRLANVHVDANDKLHYAYSDQTDNDSYYVTNESGSWVSTEITHASHDVLNVYDMAVDDGTFYFANVSGSTYFFNSYDGSDWVDGFDFALSGYLNDRVVVSDAADRIMVVSENSSGWEIHYHTATIASYITPTVSNVAPTISGLLASYNTNEDAAAYLDMSAVTVADTESDAITLTLAVNSGTLTSSDGDGITGGVTVANSGSASLTLSGAAADINTYLDTTTKIQFAPTANVNTAVTITATPNDATGSGTAATSTITVAALNDDPTATSVPTDITVTEDVASNVDLSAITFADVDADSGSVVLTLAVSAGTLAASDSGGVTVGGSTSSTITLTGTVANIDTFLNTASNVQYTSVANASGNDAATLTLTANDGGNTGSGGGANVSLGTINVDITSVDDTPSDIGLSATSINESDTSTGADVGSLSSTDADSSSFTYSLISTGAADAGTCSADTNNASFQINGTTLETASSLAAGDYDICLQTSDSDTSFEESFSITVVDNIAPVITITSLTTADSTPALSGNVDDTTAAIQVTVNSVNYVATNNSNGTWSLADNTISALTHGTWEVAVTATDGASNVGNDATSDELVVDIEGPSGHSASIDQANIDATNESAMSFTFASAEVGASFSYSVTDGSTNVTGSGTISSAGLQVTNINVSGLNETMLTLSAVLTDALGNTATAVTDTVVKQYNNAPVITEGASTSVTMSEDANPTAFSLTLNATDGDAETITWSIATNGSNGTASVAGTGASKVISYSPVAHYFGTDSFIVEVTDGITTDQITVNVTVAAVNDAPTFSSSGITSVNEDSAYSYSITTADIDANARTIVATTKPTWLSFTDNTNGTASLSGTPTNSDVGDHSVLLTVSDGTVSDTQSFTVTVNNTNDAPVISGTPTTSINEDSAYSFTPTVSDVDVGDSFVYSITNQPTWASFSTSTGLLSGTPDNDDVGTTSGIIIGVNDGTTTVSLASFNITVVNTNDAPVISGTPTTSVNEDSAYSFTPTASDVDVGDTLIYSITNTPNWASFNTGSGTLSGTPDNDDVGTSSNIVITVTDGTVSESLASFNLTVVNTNDAPIISGTPTTSINEDSPYSFTPIVSDVDVGDSFVYSITNQPTWASFSTSTGLLSGTPDNDDVGTTSGIIIGVNDGTTTVSLASFNITVVNTNDAPVISGTPTTSVNEDSAYSFTPTASDVDVGDTLIYSITNMPGWASFNTSTGELSGTPDNSDVGTDSHIIISVNDGTVTVSLASFIIDVTNVNDGPVAINDSATTTEDTSVIVSVLINDSDVDDALNPASVLIVSSPSNGTTSLNTGSGAITYTPIADFNSTDSFTYTVEDATGATSNIATVTLSISAENDAPVATADTANTPEDTPFSIDVIANDSDIDSGDSVDGSTIVIVSQPENATASVVNGEIYFDPNEQFNGSTSFTYTVDDQNGATSNVATVMVNVTGVNDLPSALDDSASLDEDNSVQIDVLVNDSDMDGTINASTVAILSDVSNGLTSINSTTGVITYTPRANFNGRDSFTYVVQDNDGGSSNAGTVSLTVASINDSPITVTDTATLMEDNPTTVNVLGNDSDIDGTIVEASVQIVTGPADGHVQVQANGSIIYTPDTNYYGDDSFSYQVQDNDDAWSSETNVNVTISSVNDSPLANNDSITTNEDTAVVIDLLVNDSDADGMLDSHTLVIVSSPSNGALVDNTDGTVTYTSSENYFGSDRFTYQINDDSGDSSNTASVNITVNPVNDAPQISGIPAASVNEDSTYSFTPITSDIEADDLSFSIENMPSWANFNSSNGMLSGTPDNSAVGIYGAIVISANDGTDTTSSSAFEIEVVNTNDLPVLSGTPASGVNQDQVFNFEPDAVDVDPGDTLTYSINFLPSWASFDPQTGRLSGIPNNAAVGSYNGIIISVSDGAGTVEFPAFDISVDNVNDAPVAVADLYNVAEGGAVSGANVLDNDFDIDADGLTVTLISGPDSASSFSLSGSGAISYMHDGSESIFDQFSYQISDGTLQSAVVTVDIDIDAINDAPTFVTEPDVLSLVQGQSFFYDIGVVDPDSVANLQLVSGPSWLTLNGSELSGVVPFDEVVGLVNIVLRASDTEFTVDQGFDVSVVERETSVVSLSTIWTGLPSVVDELLTLKIALNHQQGPAVPDGNLLVVLTGSDFEANMSDCTALADNEFDCPVTLNTSGNLSFNLKLTPHSEGDVVVNLDVSDISGDVLISKITDVSPSLRAVNQGDTAFLLDNATAIASIEMNADSNKEIAAGTALGDTVKLLDYETDSDDATVLGEIENRGETKALGVADIDLDGSEDLLVVNTAGDATAVYYQRGELNFVEDGATVSLPYANQGVLQDLNSDEFPELILGGSGFNLYIYENILGVYSQAPYVFTSKKSIKRFARLKQKPDQAPMSGTLALASSDALVLIDFAITAGKITTKVGAIESDQVGIRNKLQISQRSELSIPGITEIRVADLNGDGVEELVVSTRHENNSSAQSGVTIIDVDSASQMTEMRKLGNASADNVEIADFNGDGIPDLLIANENNTYQFYHGDGTSTGFSLKDTVIYNESNLVLPNDINGDGLSDLLIYVAESDRVDLYISDSSGDLGASADLTLSTIVETVSSTSYDIRQQLTVANSGGQTAEDVIITVDIPDHFTVVSLPDECMFEDAQITCNLGELAANESQTVTFIVNGDADVNGQVLSSRVTSAALEMAPENNKSTMSLNGLFESTSAGVKGGASGGGAINFGLLGLFILLWIQQKIKCWRQLAIVSVFLLACSNTHGQSLLNIDRMYAEFAVGSASSNWSESEFLAELQTVTQDVEITRVKIRRSTWQLLGGYEINNWLSGEAGYQSWGDVDVQLSVTTNDPDGLRELLANDYPVSGAGPYLGVRVHYEFNYGMSIYARAGVLAWQGAYDVTIGESVLSVERDGMDLVSAFGMTKSLHTNISLGVGFQFAELSGENQSEINVRVRYVFSGK